MGFFNKFFGANDPDNTSAGKAEEDDFFTALSMQLEGDLESACVAYQVIETALPDFTLAPFFAATIQAATDDAAGAAERLRELSFRCSTKGVAISRWIAQELFTLFNNEPTLEIQEVAAIIVACGDRLKAAGFVREAAVCFEIASVVLPDDPSVHYKLGDTLHDLGNYGYAEVALKKALDLAPNYWDALYTFAVLLHDLGRYTEAITYYEQAVTLNPDHVKGHNNYGAALMQVNRLDEALFHCSLAAQRDPGFTMAKVNLGNIHLLKQDYEAARTFFNEALALDKGAIQAYYGLGSVEVQTGGETARVLELYRKALELNPALPTVRHAVGNLLAEAGELEALEHFAVAVQLDTARPGLQRDFGRACLRLGRRAEGLEHLRLALAQHPDDATARELLAQAQGEG